MDWRDWIEQKPEVMFGKPVFKGTRLTVEHIHREIGNGMSEQDLLSGYPNLRREHLRAAHLYVADMLVLEHAVA
jgi:uncharacterized protein (DUF433 family)